jgi:hypothetical protein
MRREERMQRIQQLQIQVENLITQLAEPGIGMVVVISEVDMPPGSTFKGMVSLNVRETHVPKLLESALRTAREQLASGGHDVE